MMPNQIKQLIASTFLDLSDALLTGEIGNRPTIALTGIGSEHGEDNAIAGALAANAAGVNVIYIGTKKAEGLNLLFADNEQAAHNAMESLLTSGEVDGAVTMHYPFPIGISTVGRCITPAFGKPVFLATTTGTSATDRVESLIRNAFAGIIAAKACGNSNPTVGIVNIEGAHQAETELKKLCAQGYPIQFAESKRADGGCILRGNDILMGAADIIVTDSLTGNLIIKMLSAFNTGGNYESVGWGYGPGIGEGYDRLVMIISRASGAPVIKGALTYAGNLVRGGWRVIAAREYLALKKAGLEELLSKRRETKSAVPSSDVKMPAKEVVTGQISGVEVLEMEDAVNALWRAGCYAESGMGCTGPIILVAESRMEQATAELKKAGYLG